MDLPGHARFIGASLLDASFAQMKFLRRIALAIRTAVFGRFESAWHKWGERSWINQGLQDARFDIDKWTREELQRRHRYWVTNNGFVVRLRELFIQFGVGVTGLECVPNSKDETWNEALKLSWDGWCKKPELNTNLTLAFCDVLWAGMLFDAGEVFIQLTEDKRGRPAILTTEAHSVVTPGPLRKEEGKTIIDGIRVDSLLKPLAYFVKTGPKAEDYKEVPAYDPDFPEQGGMLHLFKRIRPGQLRGIPEGYAVMNELHDLDDLQILQMQKAKAAAIITNVIKNAAGEADVAQLRRTRMMIQSQNAAGAPVTKDQPVFYDTQLGAHTKYLRTGEEMQQFRQEEPGIVTQQYWDYTLSKICCGYNQPKLLVMPYTLQGTVTRADLDVCANAYKKNFEVIAWGKRQIYEWRNTWAIRFDRSLDGEPDDALEVIIRAPRSPNVDVGYSAQALDTELRLGTKSFQDVLAERQQDWRDHFRQVAETEAYIDRLAKEFGISPDRIAKKLKESVSVDGETEQPNQPDQPETPDKELTNA